MEYKILSYLLFYPNEEFLSSLGEIASEIKQYDMDEKVKSNFLSFINKIKDEDIYDVQSAYVGSFDNNPSLSLYLFDHVMGDSKARGEALVNLKQEYIDNNFDISKNYLPDYLPVFLEFVSQIPKNKALELMSPLGDLFNDLCLRHRKVNSEYAVLFENLVLLMGNHIQEKDVKVLSSKEINDMWKDQEVTFGSNNSDNKCSIK